MPQCHLLAPSWQLSAQVHAFRSLPRICKTQIDHCFCTHLHEAKQLLMGPCVCGRLLADAEVVNVNVDYIITPSTNEMMTDLFSQILTPGFANSTAALGLRMGAVYRNSTIRLASL